MPSFAAGRDPVIRGDYCLVQVILAVCTFGMVDDAAKFAGMVKYYALGLD
jgi:hypothetical protein